MQREMNDLYKRWGGGGGGFFRTCRATILVQRHLANHFFPFSLAGRTSRKEKDAQGSREEEDNLHAPVRERYNDWREAQSELARMAFLLRGGLRVGV